MAISKIKPMKTYNDIINLPHHRSPRRGSMSREARAAQFAPFAALTGFDGVICETGRLTKEAVELTEEELQRLDSILRHLADRIGENPQAVITYFCPDRHKKGGAYVCAVGVLKKIDLYRREVCMEDGTMIPIDRIYAVEILSERKTQGKR